jgi:hypothetical protein
MGIEMEKRRLASCRQPGIFTGDRLHYGAGDPMITANRYRSGSSLIDVPKESGDPLDRTFVVAGLGKRHIAEVVDPAGGPRIKVEGGMITSRIGRDVAHGARAEMLIAFSGIVACRMRHANQRDIGVRRNGVERRPE